VTRKQVEAELCERLVRVERKGYRRPKALTFGQYAETTTCSRTRSGTRLDAHWYRREFQAALAAAGVEGHIRTFHDMQHTAITNLAASGASPIAVMTTAGHRSMSTTKGYLHLAGVVFREDALALERRLLGVEDPVETTRRQLY
jgi:integrase